MELGATAQIAAFAVFALLGVLGALGMATTMSMFRSAIFLMASFVGVAGLFILLLADLLGMLQVMMYVGGMLVMALFMVLFSGDPGGEMMASMMTLRGPERFFSLGLSRPQDDGDDEDDEDDSDDSGDEDQEQSGGDDESGDEGQEQDDSDDSDDSDDEGQEQGGGHGDMSMFTPVKMPAAVLAGLVGTALVTLILLRPDAWASSPALPDPDSSSRIGHLLMGKYMVGFEGAGLLILLGIFGAVWVARAARRGAAPDREDLRAAIDEAPRDVDGRAPDQDGES